jgi:hypothetical protein
MLGRSAGFFTTIAIAPSEVGSKSNLAGLARIGGRVVNNVQR